MNILEGWNMYLEIQDLKKMRFNVSQISRRLDLSRTTVYKYLDMTPEEMEQILENRKTRTKKIDKHRELIKSWLIQYQDMTSTFVNTKPLMNYLPVRATYNSSIKSSISTSSVAETE